MAAGVDDVDCGLVDLRGLVTFGCVGVGDDVELVELVSRWLSPSSSKWATFNLSILMLSCRPLTSKVKYLSERSMTLYGPL